MDSRVPRARWAYYWVIVGLGVAELVNGWWYRNGLYMALAASFLAAFLLIMAVTWVLQHHLDRLIRELDPPVSGWSAVTGKEQQ